MKSIAYKIRAKYPSLYQINTRVWINELSKKLGKSATLDDIPGSELDKIRDMGFGWIWFLSVWQTGEAGRIVSRNNPQWQKEFKDTLPDLSDDDVSGSGFAITAYKVSRDLGGEAALKRLRNRLSSRGIKLMLDFVPNHTALDHPWVNAHPEYYIHGGESDLQNNKDNYVKVSSNGQDIILAYGRDPYFSGWPDTLQLNYGCPSLQAEMIGILKSISELCDGLRCDMAMLITPQVFENTWGIRIQEFWHNAIREVRKIYPEFVMLAEVYWDMEWELLQQGFDYAYDKRLYDRLQQLKPQPVREHLYADLSYQDRLARFLENHDEQRAASVFDKDAHKAAAIINYMTPGLRFFYQGQFEGKKKKISPHLNRGPEEEIDKKIQTFYYQLLNVLDKNILKNGNWKLLECKPAWEGNWTWNCFIAFSWEMDEKIILTVVNYAPNHSQCFVKVPYKSLTGGSYSLDDCFTSEKYIRDGSEMFSNGLFIDLPPWGFSVFSFSSLGI